MKKISLILGIALILVLALASLTFAAQAKVGDYYQPTAKTFNADGSTNYPNEIYLPNEASPASYRIHSNYSKNTDACASCHATHTAVGKSLLQWYSVFDTCMACHDGTVTTTYNVEGGYIGPSSDNRSTYGGAFGVGNEDYLSNHNVSGALAIAAAPGGSTIGTSVTVGHDSKNVWVSEFGCESCHTPHGQGGNARILNPDPNFVQTAAASATGYNTTAKDGSAYVVAAPATKAVASGYYYFINGYPYSISVYNLDDNAKLTATTQYTVDSSAGYTKISLIGLDPTAGIRVYGTPAMTVTMDIDNYLSSTESVKHLSGMNNFCGACHTDYNTQTAQTYTDGKFSGSGEKLTGTYSEAYRHQIGFSTGAAAGLVTEGGKMSCLTCHVAHGTSKDYWQRTLVDAAVKGPDGTTWATGDLVEIAGSSALKRMPNMGTCEACHKKEVGNQGYAVNSGMTSSQTPATVDATATLNAWGKPVAAADRNWVGSAACASCHSEYYTEWKSITHGQSSHKTSSTCGGFDQTNAFGCHQNGMYVMYTTAADPTVFNATYAGADNGATCETCHGSGAKHVKAPSAKNIVGPSTINFDQKVYTCARCHDVYTQGTGALPFNPSVSAPMFKGNGITVNPSGYVNSVVYGGTQQVISSTAPTIAANSSIISSGHPGAWGYADSKHYIQKIVACSDCHNAHNGEMKLSYEQLCTSCHDAVGAIDATMGKLLGHSQVDHSFAYGFTGQTIPNDAVVTLAASTSSGTYSSNKTRSSDRVATAAVVVKSADGLTLYTTNTKGQYELVAPAAAVAGIDYTFQPEGGVLTFPRATMTTNSVGQYQVKLIKIIANPNIAVPADPVNLYKINP